MAHDEVDLKMNDLTIQSTQYRPNSVLGWLLAGPQVSLVWSPGWVTLMLPVGSGQPLQRSLGAMLAGKELLPLP